MTILISNLAIAGYRSFGKAPQYFECFAKINLIIGQNNAGKSNVIRFLDEVYRRVNERPPIAVAPLSWHLPDKPPVILGIGERLDLSDPQQPQLSADHPLLAGARDIHQRQVMSRLFGKLLQEKSRLDGVPGSWTMLTFPERVDKQTSWFEAMKVLADHEIKALWNFLTNTSGGDRASSWEPQVAKRLPATPPTINVAVVPAIRQVGDKGSVSETFDGNGIIERLARLQNPDVHNQASRKGFADITQFLQTVIDRPDARIEIPYERDTILVHMDDKVLPIESLGSGIHEVIILAAAATVLSGHVLCIEEPELHLNPILQRKLMRYLAKHTQNQYFITTHSAALMDAPGAEIYHVRMVDRASVVERVTSDRQRSAVCEDLGYHPSDLLQANCVIWVEGPSDRIYLNYWLAAIDPTLVEGVHYSIMFYGGRLAAHLTNEEGPDSEVNDFISLRRLNRRGVIVIDSDRVKSGERLNATKRRLQTEFDSGPGHAWITDGREIENYLPPEQIEAAITASCPKSRHPGGFDRFDNTLRIVGAKGRETQAPKVDVARYIAGSFEPDFSRLDLKSQLNKLCKFILASNPAEVQR